MLVGGIQGSANDRDAYKLTQVYQHPSEYMLPDHKGLFDGVFNGAAHVETTEPGLLPFSAAQLRAAPPSAEAGDEAVQPSAAAPSCGG